jgi:hypothetical protein
VLKFNNSVLFCPTTSTGPDYWEMGRENYQAWLELLGTLPSQPLEKTRLVLKTRQTLMAEIQEIHRLIAAGFVKLESMKQEREALKQHTIDIAVNKDFTIQVTEQKREEIPTDPGVHVTNCVVCNRTCHAHCVFAKKEDKYKCAAMKDGYCKMCTARKCPWQDHQNDPFYYKFSSVVVEKTSKEILARYQKATSDRVSSDAVLAELQTQFDVIKSQVKQHVEAARQKVKELYEISARPNPFSPVEYIDLLMDGERQERRPGWNERVQIYQEFRDEAALGEKLVSGVAFDPWAAK